MKGFFTDSIGQLFTALGMFVAWICLEGQAKTIVGWLTILSFVIWFATYPLRRDDE